MGLEVWLKQWSSYCVSTKPSHTHTHTHTHTHKNLVEGKDLLLEKCTYTFWHPTYRLRVQLDCVFPSAPEPEEPNSESSQCGEWRAMGLWQSSSHSCQDSTCQRDLVVSSKLLCFPWCVTNWLLLCTNLFILPCISFLSCYTKLVRLITSFYLSFFLGG
jgi:hypothetical protein